MTNNNIKIDFDRKVLKLPKIKIGIKYHDDRVFNEQIHSVTVSKTKSGNYYASILIEKCDEKPKLTSIIEEKVIAFDMSLKDFLVTKEYKLSNPRFFRNTLNKIKKAHRKVSRSVKKSNNRQKACHKLAKVYDRYVHQKHDWVHKITTKLTNDKEAVILEDLNIEGMKCFNKGYAKSVTKDFSWSEFVTILTYKMARKGKYLIKVDRFFPSSQLCSHCGYQNKELKLSERDWTCPQCKMHHNRDVNASENIKKEGLRILQEQHIILIRATEGTSGSHACRDCVIPHDLEVTVDEARIQHL